MEKLCRTSRGVGTLQSLINQPRTKAVRWIIVTSILLFTGSAWNLVAGQKSVNVRGASTTIPAAKSNLTGTRAGVKITGVGPKSAAVRAGLKYGDVLIAYNNRPITNEDELDGVIRFFQRQFDQSGRHVVAELSLYRGGDLTV